MLPVALARWAAATALLLLLLLDEGSGMGVPGGGCRATRGSCVVSGAVAAAGAAARLGVGVCWSVQLVMRRVAGEL